MKAKSWGLLKGHGRKYNEGGIMESVLDNRP